jgi:predicted DNA-binding protein
MTEHDRDQELCALADAIADGDYEMLDEPVPLPPAAAEEPKVVRSIRLDVDVDKRARAAAAERGVPVTAFLRDLIEAGLAGLEDDAPISRADAVRALLGLHPVPPAA